MRNITDQELAREVEALKSHRRISVNRPILDPDLPDMAAVRGGGQEIMAASPHGSASGSGSGSIRSRSSHGSGGGSGSGDVASPPTSLRSLRSDTSSFARGVTLNDDGPSTPTAGGSTSTSSGRQAFTARRRAGAGEGSSSSSSSRRPRSPSAQATAPPSSASPPPQTQTDPSHLFWVPASIHPEISPSHFKQFLQEHASRAVRESATTTPDPTGLSNYGVVATPPTSPTSGVPASPPSFASRQTSIARRGSTLRRQYRPENDLDDDDEPPTPTQAPHRPGEPALSILDLQKLEALAEEASKSIDENELRSVLRRTMSLGAGASTMDTVDAVPHPTEDADSPLIVPPPGQILRRAARTKIRKSSMSGIEGTERLTARGSRRRAMGGQSMSGSSAAGSDTASDSGAPGPADDRKRGDSQQDLAASLRGNDAGHDLASLGLSLMQRRPSDASDLTSSSDDETQGPRSRDEATDAIVDAYSRDSIISDGSQRTSATSWTGESGDDTYASFKGKETAVEDRGQRAKSPPDTPTQASVQGGQMPSSSASAQGGYFDIPSTTSSGSSPTARSRSRVLVDSPVQSPETEAQPSAGSLLEQRSQTDPQQPPPSSWPVPVSHVPPVPSFEKARSAAQQQQAQRPSSQQAAAPTRGAPQAPPAPRGAQPQSALAQLYHEQRQQQQQQQARSQTVGTTSPSPPPPPPTQPTVPSSKSKDRDKRSGGFASWFGIGKDEDEGARAEKKREKAQRKEQQRERDEEAQASSTAGPYASTSSALTSSSSSSSSLASGSKGEKEKDVGSFLGALFGKKKGRDDSSSSHDRQPGRGGHGGPDGHAVTAGSLLDQRYSRQNAYRYPIHIERAVYRLSHIKLANPRRPLYEQVLISNLMFWYLSVVNKTQQQQQQQQAQAQQQSRAQEPRQAQEQIAQQPASAAMQISGGGESGSSDVVAPIIEAAPVPAPSASRASASSSSAPPPPSKTKKSGLVKPNRAPPGGHRSAETPILAAGYGAQHRQINNDLAMQAQQQQQYSLAAATGGISVGQVIDPRALQYAYLQQAQAQEHGGAEEDGTTSTSPRTSPNIVPQRTRGTTSNMSSSASSGSGADLATSSGAWLGGGRSSGSVSSGSSGGGGGGDRVSSRKGPTSILMNGSSGEERGAAASMSQSSSADGGWTSSSSSRARKTSGLMAGEQAAGRDREHDGGARPVARRVPSATSDGRSSSSQDSERGSGNEISMRRAGPGGGLSPKATTPSRSVSGPVPQHLVADGIGNGPSSRGGGGGGGYRSPSASSPRRRE